jgi:Ca2+-binding RTX toxin-like protein
MSSRTGFDKLESIEDATGGDYNDDLIGSSAANALFGEDGDDDLTGLRGADRYKGGLGADVFYLTSAKDSGLGVNADWITDFSGSSGEGDKINLRAIDAKKGFSRNDDFVFIGNEAPASPGSGSMGVVWFQGGYLMASTDKDTAAEFAIKVDFKAGAQTTLTEADINL